ncbi:MAG: proprotein convertase P-domain-containing protein [Deltaproteobacteria bacterium]|nr:proprotein convertase P-domain-containing protein [Deltaproteobacteria bacterium]
MRDLLKFAAFVGGLALLAGCEAGSGSSSGPNPFLEDQGKPGKADTQYLNPDGIEVEVDLEADIEAGGYSWRLDEGPAVLGQFALTYLRTHGEFYLESLAEDASSTARVEWLVDEKWITAAEAESVSRDKLKRFRIRGVNAILLHGARNGVTEGTVFKAPVPVNPFNVMTDAGNTCAEEDGHITLGQSVYWYMWAPDKTTCKIKKQDMTLTVSKLMPVPKLTYPEFDRLTEDKKVTAVVLFGQIGDGEISDTDIGMRGFREMGTWLVQAGFKPVTPAPIGRRFTKRIGDYDFEIDLYSPHDFSGLGDFAHIDNFKTALKEHEIVVYDGHSMLGASDFWARDDLYSDGYQIFLYGGCLGYQYYVRPIVQSKGGWGNVDIMSSVIEVSVGANEFAGPVLAKIAWALDHNFDASWKDLVQAVRKRVRDSTFGVSGVRDNCFSPAGPICGVEPDPAKTKRFEDAAATEIPDAEPTGVVRKIDVEEEFTPRTVALDLEVAHAWIGDLKVSVEHDGVEVVVWDHAGSSGHGISQTFTLTDFANKPAKGRWTLLVVDDAAKDAGTLKKWSLAFAMP